MEAVGLGIVSNFATEIIKKLISPLISILKSAARCEDACRQLEEKLVDIQEQVEGITRQLNQMQTIEPHSKQAVEKLLSELKEELHLAKIVVHHCTSGSKLKVGRLCNVPKNADLTKEINAHCEKISRLADRSLVVSLLLGVGVSNASASASSNEGSTMLAKWNSEKNDILHSEDSTRLTERYLECQRNSWSATSSSPLP